MSRHPLRPLAVAAFVALILTACGGESLSGFAIDQALDASGEDVDFDFEDGGFSISGEDGEVTFDFDSEDGTFSFGSEDGSGTARIDEQGNVIIETDEGNASFNIDADEGSATFSSDEGSGFASQTVPENWPAVFGVPQTLVESQSFFGVFEDNSGTSYNSAVVYDPGEDFVGAVEARLEAAGFERIETGAQVAGFSQWEGQGLSVTLSGTNGQTTIVAGPSN